MRKWLVIFVISALVGVGGFFLKQKERPDAVIAWRDCTFNNKYVRRGLNKNSDQFIVLYILLRGEGEGFRVRLPETFTLNYRENPFLSSVSSIKSRVMKQAEGGREMLQLPDYLGFNVYKETREKGDFYYIKDFPSEVLIRYPAIDIWGMRVYRKISPDLEVDYVSDKSKFDDLSAIDKAIDFIISDACGSGVFRGSRAQTNG